MAIELAKQVLCGSVTMWGESAKLRTCHSRSVQDEVDKSYLSEVGFEPTPTEVDCDLNAAP